nr:MAG TPA: L SHAPED TAIL FIBER PROTEIN [Caudoviricetes sp.]
MTRTIPLKIQNEYITGDKVLIGAAGSHNDVVLRMEFSPMWEGLTKTVQFRDALGETTIEVLLTADMLEADDTSVYLVPVPNGAKKYAGEMTLCVKGAAVAGEKETRATTAVYGRFTVGESKWDTSAETEQDVPPTQAEQLQSQIENVLATIVDARKAATEAAASADAAAGSADAAGNSADAAAESALQAKNMAESALTSSQSALESAKLAQTQFNGASTAKTNAEAAATAAGESASAASASAGLASSSAAAAKTSETNAKSSETSAAGSAAAADNSEKKATAAATKAEAASNHPPRINSNGKWELWDFDNSQYVATSYDAQGPKGDTGATGAAAGFGTPSATVDANVGTPSVQISASGPDTAKVFAFTFRNLKGDKGDKGDSGDSYTVLGLYGTLLALQAAHPTGEAGQAWFVGTADDNVVYQWDVDKGQWVNVGALKGPKGDKGETGSPGANGAPGAAGKSAYASAQDGGYTGTETQFNSDLAKIADKADKMVPAAAGNLAALDAAGNLSDSGKKPADFQAKVTASGLLKGDGNGGVTAAAAGTDYSGPKATVAATLLAASWTGSEAPFVYTLAIAGVTATSYQELLPAVNITAEQLKALQAANITDGGQAAGSMTLKAYGKKPTVDIPIRVIKEGE